MLETIKATVDTKISVLGHDGKVLEYLPEVNPAPSFTQKDSKLHLDIMRAQRIYNNSRWPNPIVVKLTAVEPVP